MTEHRFTAYALAAELDQDKLAAHVQLTGKFRWEEPVIIDPLTCRQLTAEGLGNQQVYLYNFGGMVFVDCSDGMIREFAEKMADVIGPFQDFAPYKEQYALRIEDDARPAITNDYAVMPRSGRVFVEIIAFVIAKSVALERIEAQVDKGMDEMEALIALLEQGKLTFPDKRLAKVASKILSFKYRSIAYVMVLDKPDITWEDQEADRLYRTMANLFELSQRYSQIRHKSETLMDITNVFSNLSHARREMRLEVVIVILIFIEIVIYLLQH